MNKRFLGVLVVVLFLASCTGIKRGLRPSIMLKTSKNFKYDIIPDSLDNEYRIAANDRITMQLYSNDGFKLIELTTLGSKGSNSSISRQNSSYYYIVEEDGRVRFPIIGRIPVGGKTLKELETYLEDIYSKYYVKPYTIIRITNRRVFVFPGKEGGAQIVPLINRRTTLLQALASVGGISNDGKAYQIKLIRGNANNPKVYLIDLSTIKGMHDANIALQANDIIYVVPYFHGLREFVSAISPVLTLFSSVVSVLGIIAILNR